MGDVRHTVPIVNRGPKEVVRTLPCLTIILQTDVLTVIQEGSRDDGAVVRVGSTTRRSEAARGTYMK